MNTTERPTYEYLESLCKDELLKYAFAGNEDAQVLASWNIAIGCWDDDKDYDTDPKELWRVANLGWKKAQSLVWFGYKFGDFGFEKDHAKAEECRQHWGIDTWLTRWNLSTNTGATT